MKKSKHLFIAVIFILITGAVACTSPNKKLSADIAEKEKTLYGDSTMVPDAVKAKEMVDLYLKYADEFPDETASASYLFKAGDLSSKLNETQKAIDLFGRMLQKFPNHSSAPYALFLQGFIYENQVGDPMKAKPYYETFLKTYPDHPIASDVSFSLENLGKSPEQLIQEFENRQQEQNGGTSSDSTEASVSR